MEPEDLRKWLVKFEEGLGLILGRTEQAIRILTCYHVIEDDLTRPSIPLRWIPYSEGAYSKKPLELKAQVVDENAKNTAEDWAILEATYDQNPELKNQIPHLPDPPLDFDVTNVARGNVVYCYRAAVFEEGGQLDIALDPTMVALRAIAADLSTASLMQLSKKAIQPGDSGTPVLQIGGRIIGIVLGRWPPRDPNKADEAFAIYMLPFSAIPLDQYVDYQSASLASISDSLRLGHVLRWSWPAMEKVVKKDLLLQSVEDLAQLLQASETWPSFLERLKKADSFWELDFSIHRLIPQNGPIVVPTHELGPIEWFLKAFSSIRQGAKGLYDALHLDYALISVPPLPEQWKRVLTTLEEAGIFGITAPPGWGKSRLVLWIALARALQGGHAIYYADPEQFLYDLAEYEKRQAGDLRAFLRSLADNRIPSLLIIDDCHRREDENWLRAMIREARRENSSGAPSLGLMLLLLQTRQPHDREDRAWPEELKPKYRFASKEYVRFWEGIWKKRFVTWFAALIDKASMLKIHLDEDRLGLAEKTNSPWAFVSVLIDLRQLLKKQLRHLSDRLVFTMVQYGFAITNEEGLSPEALFNGLRYLYEKAQEGQSPFIAYWEQIQTYLDDDLWESVADNNAGDFSRHLKILVENWQKTPDNPKQIRLLPHAGLDTSYKRVRPIKSYHAEWWTALCDMWTYDTEWQAELKLLFAVQQVVLSGTPTLNCGFLTRTPGNAVYWSDRLQFDSKKAHEFLEMTKDTLEILGFPGLRLLGAADVWSDLLRHCHHLQDLDLSSRNLCQVPESITQLPLITSLNLSATKLTDLPESLRRLKLLQKLELGANQLKTLPEWFGQLSSLRELSLDRNELSDLPESFGDLRNLQRLNLDGNQLTSLPASFGGLVKLQKLSLNENQLTSLPASFGSLTNLRTLCLNENRFSVLPDSLGLLFNLQRLEVARNELQYLLFSKIFQRLTDLKCLNLSNNQLKSIRGSFGSLSNLESLVLDFNRLRDLQGSLVGLTKLKYLHIANNELIALPESFGDLRNLEQLDLSGSFLISLPDSFGALTRLYWLDLSYNHLFILPETFGGLRALTTLSICYNYFGNDGKMMMMIEQLPRLCDLKTDVAGDCKRFFRWANGEWEDFYRAIGI
ncbi:MAG: leucine-rich repeat domain-containing protein [Candidatus Heimdallarchaeota archaeon]